MKPNTSIPMEQTTSKSSSEKPSEEQNEEIATQTIYAKLKQVRLKSFVNHELFLEIYLMR